ncbi:MAG: hypothetical protein M9921_09190 [Fimbriimonadaceae bacterium]|nr:hypothetical protein [Fimbriimonadaceae bacterium]
MGSIWTSDRIGPFLIRQIFGGVLLLGATVLSFAVGVNPLDDLNGMFGLWALFSMSLMVPPRWLAWALAFDGLALAVLGVYWLLQWSGGNGKALSPALGFLFASLCCFAAGRIASRGKARSEKC